MSKGHGSSKSYEFYNIKDKKLLRYVGTDEPKDMMDGKYIYFDKDGTNYYYEHATYLCGNLINAKIEENRFGQQELKLIIEDPDTLDTVYSIGINVYTQAGNLTSVARDFFTRMMSINVSEQLRIAIYNKKETFNGTDYEFTHLSLQQKVDNEYTACKITYYKDDMPPVVEKKKGKDIIKDQTDLINFLYEKFEGEFLPKFIAPKTTTTTKATKKTESVVVDPFEAEVDDLPFD